jgi:hypothetical protein
LQREKKAEIFKCRIVMWPSLSVGFRAAQGLDDLKNLVKTMCYKTLDRKPNIEQHEPLLKPRVNSGGLE